MEWAIQLKCEIFMLSVMEWPDSAEINVIAQVIIEQHAVIIQSERDTG